MKHCEKLGVWSPSVETNTEWKNLLHEIIAVSPDCAWLSLTEGDIGDDLGKLNHWSEGVEAEESVWRD